MAEKKDFDSIKAAIKTARENEKVAIASARRKVASLVDEMVAHEHATVVEEIHRALVMGMSSRKIGEAYGSSDPHTIRRLMNEAVAGVTSNSGGAHPEWKLTRNHDGTFTITAYSLGEAKLSGSGVFSIDEDGENFSLIEGDAFIAVQLYKLGQKDIVLEEARG